MEECKLRGKRFGLIGFESVIAVDDAKGMIQKFNDVFLVARTVDREHWQNTLEEWYKGINDKTSSIPLTGEMKRILGDETLAHPQEAEAILKMGRLICECDEAFVSELGNMVPANLRPDSEKREAACKAF